MAKKAEAEAEETKAGLRALNAEEAAELTTLLEIAVNSQVDIEAMLKRIYPAHPKNLKDLRVPKAWLDHIASAGGITGKYAHPCGSMLGAILTFRATAIMLNDSLSALASGDVDNMGPE